MVTLSPHTYIGQTVTVELYPSLADLTQVDPSGKRAVAPGKYRFKFGVMETVDGGGGYVDHVVTTV